MASQKQTKLTRVVFSVEYIPSNLLALSRFIANVDLGIAELRMGNTPIKDCIITTKTKVDKNYIKAIGVVLQRAFESEGHEVINMKFISSSKVYD